MFQFSNANKKTKALYDVEALKPFLIDKKKVYSFDLLSGHSCPQANICLSKVVNGKIQDGPFTQFRCFSASQEALFPNVYRRRHRNFESARILKEPELVRSISGAMPKDIGVCRIHVAGDFFNIGYFRAWLTIARQNPSILFYAYTKCLRHWVDHQQEVRECPNFVLTASYGGKQDILIGQHDLRFAIVVYTEEQAKAAGLEIDHTDEHAANPLTQSQNFALLIHGVQPKGSEAGKAVRKLRK